MSLRILICGDRNWDDYEKIKWFVKSLPDDVFIIEGECRGADKMARQAAEEAGVKDENILKFPADWNKHGKAAGPIRNAQMLSEGKPTHVIAYHNDFQNSRGTKDMVQRAKRADIPVYLNVEDWLDITLKFAKPL